jgi:hypothetical protein
MAGVDLSSGSSNRKLEFLLLYREKEGIALMA